MKSISNPIQSKVEWDKMRSEAESEPGAFHGKIAKSEIFWIEKGHNAWIRWSETEKKWIGYDRLTGKNVDVGNLSESFDPWSQSFDDSSAPVYRWFKGGMTNAAFNEIDRHVLAGSHESIAVIFEGEAWDEKQNSDRGGPVVTRRISYGELLTQVVRYAVVLRDLGIKRGQRIALNMSNTCEQLFFTEAAKRMGIIYTPIFGGFSAKVLADRLADSTAELVITNDATIRNGELVRTKEQLTDTALSDFFPVRYFLSELRARFENAGNLEFKTFYESLAKAIESELTVERTDLRQIVDGLSSQDIAQDQFRDEIRSFSNALLLRPFPHIKKVVVVSQCGLKDVKLHPDRDEMLSLLLDRADVQMRGMQGVLSESRLSGGISRQKIGETLYALAQKIVPIEIVDANYPLFIIYTSGSTGKPKGIVHVHGGYLVGVSYTMRVAFDVGEDRKSVIYVIADPAWITGQSYMYSAALSTGSTTVITDAAPIFPNAGRFASIVERYKVNILKAGSTFLRAVASNENNLSELKKYDLSSLRVATFCAEPVSSQIQKFAMDHVCPQYINSYWATEHGGIVCTHFYGNESFKLLPNTHTFPLPWVFADVWIGDEQPNDKVDDRLAHRSAGLGEKGEIVVTKPYPYLAFTIWGDPDSVIKENWTGDVERFTEIYYSKWRETALGPKFVYTQGDFACKHEDGGFTFHGRSDDVINTLGHRIGTEEIEGALLKDRQSNAKSPVADVVVVGMTHQERGEVPVAFIKVKSGRTLTVEDESRLIDLVSKEKGAVAVPFVFLVVDSFPETRSGKYMRRILRSLVCDEPLGDVSSLKDPCVVVQVQAVIAKWKAELAATNNRKSVPGELPVMLQSMAGADRIDFVRKSLAELLLAVIESSDRNVEKVDFEKPLREAGLDSLRTLKFVNMVKGIVGSEFEAKVSVNLVFNYPTLSAMANYILDELCGSSGEVEDLDFGNNDMSSNEPIAIVGIGCRYPGNIDSPEDFWQSLVEGRDSVTEIPLERWRSSDFFDEDQSKEGKMYVNRGGFLKDVDLFDNAFFGISPDEARALDPQQRLLLEVSWEALERANIRSEDVAGQDVGVFVGITMREYADLIATSVEKPDLEIYLPTGTNLNTAAGRISYFLGFHGPSVVVDTACSSSLVAIHLACESIRSGQSVMALAGGVNLILTPSFSISMCKAQALSREGECRTFDESAAGYVRSEGCGIVVLKRLSKAIEDGDNITAVIKGSAVNHDGRSASLTAPNGKAQEKLIQSALRAANVKPRQIGYFEAHGTGTPIGDSIEGEALGNVLSVDRRPVDVLRIGSVKSNFGHSESAAGVAGLIKTALSLQNRLIPKTLHFKKLNPNIDLKKVPAEVPITNQTWNPIDGIRIAGVSSFGFSGTNAHAIISEFNPSTEKGPEAFVVDRAAHLLCLSAKTPEALKDLCLLYVDKLSRAESSIGDICATAFKCRSQFPFRTAIVGKDAKSLSENLQQHLAGADDCGVIHAHARSSQKKIQIAFLFAGQGSQFIGMANELFKSNATFRENFLECEGILARILPVSILNVLFGGPEFEQLLIDPVYAQASLCSVEYAIAKLWMSAGVEPTVLMGHSMGEYIAACISGVMSIEDALRLVVKRVQLVAFKTAPGEMGAVMADEKQTLAAIKGFEQSVSIAALNGPTNTTITGAREDVKKVLAKLDSLGHKTKLLQIGWASHSPLVDPILEEFYEFAARFTFKAPRIPIVSNLTGRMVTTEEICDPRYWCKHARGSVRFSDGMNVLIENQVDRFIEMAPGRVMVGMGELLAGNHDGLWLASIRKDQSDWQQFLESVGALYCADTPFKWEALEKGFPQRRRVDLPTYPFQRKRFWVEQKSLKRQVSFGSEDLGHPLLGRRLFMSHSDEIIFEAAYSCESLPFLVEHLLYGTIVMPGAGHISRVLMAARSIFGENCTLVIEDAEFIQPLSIDANETKVAQLVLKKEGVDRYSYQISSRPDRADASGALTWTAHATGRVFCRGESINAVQVDTKHLSSMYQSNVSKVKIYESFSSMGLDLGPMLQGISSFSSSGNEFLARLDTPVQIIASLNEHEILPTMIDSCFQSLAVELAIGTGSKGGDFYPPVSIERIEFSHSAPKEFWCRVTNKSSSQFDKGMIKANLDLVSDDGEIFARITGLEMVEAPKQTVLDRFNGTKLSDNWYYELNWKESPIPQGVSSDESWLIFPSQNLFGERLANEIGRKGGRTIVASIEGAVLLDGLKYSSESTIKDWIGKAIASFGKLDRVVFLGALDSPLISDDSELTSQLLRNAQKIGYDTVLNLTKCIVTTPGSESARLTILTRDAQPVASDDGVKGILQSPLWGLGKVLALEHGDLKTVRIDLSATEAAIDKEVEFVVAELLADPSRFEDQVAFRDGKRMVARLQRSLKTDQIKQRHRKDLKFDKNSTYLIVGGLTGVGLSLAEWMANQGAGNICLIGRRQPSSVAQETIKRLLDRGVKVCVESADISDIDQMSAVIRRIEETMPDLRGIVNSAVVLADGIVLQQDWGQFVKVMEPKILGSWNLHMISKRLHKLDFFVCFSSSTSMLGNWGQANYAAAGAFQDALAYRRRANGQVGHTINWGPWAGTGLAAELMKGRADNFSKFGMGSILPELGFKAFENILSFQIPQVGVLPVDDWNKFAAAVG